jgi:hypothetical protein
MARTSVSTPRCPFDCFGPKHYGLTLKLLPFLFLLCLALPASADTFLVTGDALFPIYTDPTARSGFLGDETFSASYEFDTATLDVIPGTMQISTSGPPLTMFVPTNPFSLNGPAWTDSDGYILGIEFTPYDWGNGTAESCGLPLFYSCYPLPGNVGAFFITYPNGQPFVGGEGLFVGVSAVTPEPSTALLLGIGFLILFWVRCDLLGKEQFQNISVRHGAGRNTPS